MNPRAAGVALALLVATAPTLTGQSAAGLTVAANARVRVWSDAPAIHGSEFRVSMTRGDTLWLSSSNAEILGVPLKTVARLDARRSRSHLLGAAIGGLAGGLVGALVGSEAGKSDARASDGISLSLGPIVFGLAGASVGLVVGAAATGEHWVTVWPRVCEGSCLQLTPAR